jgi:hypothetical protein
MQQELHEITGFPGNSPQNTIQMFLGGQESERYLLETNGIAKKKGGNDVNMNKSSFING